MKDRKPNHLSAPSIRLLGSILSACSHDAAPPPLAALTGARRLQRAPLTVAVRIDAIAASSRPAVTAGAALGSALCATA
ncbi:MAG TPA: hypothetical protein VMO47_05490, partial [Rhodothermales bacterium]|nr:hypothetical protein [Rhodothermales bacterium]